MLTPPLPTGPIPRDWDAIDAERGLVLGHIAHAAHSLDPGNAKIEIERASARLIQIVAADYDTMRREDEERGVYDEH